MEKLPPKSLYKYQSLTAQTLQNLKGQCLYFGSPKNFNDPYDCALSPIISRPTDSDVREIREHYLKDKKMELKVRQDFDRSSLEVLRESFQKAGREALEKTTNSFLEKSGVTCFSERNDNLLMWSHYGGSCTGICLEFSTASDMFKKMRKVNYVEKPPSINLVSLLKGEIGIVETLFCTKSDVWKYEEEWRVSHNAVGTEYGYPDKSLTGVYFGPDIDRQMLEIVCLILQGQNPHVKFWRGLRSATEFKVLFEGFTYTPYLDVKIRG